MAKIGIVPANRQHLPDIGTTMNNGNLGAPRYECPSPWDIWNTLNEPWCDRIRQIPTDAVVLINEAEPTQFLAYLWSGLLAKAALVLANPNWQQQEWQQVAAQLKPDVILGQPPPVSFNLSNQQPEPGQILIATGGTSGKIKFVIHTWATLSTAAQGFLTHFDQTPVNSYCVLPLYHVSGLMQAIRVWLSGGQLIIQPFKDLDADQRLVQPNQTWFISLVPTQLQRLIKNGNTLLWLSQFRAILLGGAPAWPTLLAQTAQLPIALTYGMSETAAQVATLLPTDFQQGVRSNGSPLPHVTLAVHELKSFQPQPVGTMGRIALRTASLGLGYWPAIPLSPHQSWFYPDDLGYIDQQGHLHIVGRHSQKIITGGENVFPVEVEAAILATGLVQDICVVGLPDPVWGQAVAALCVPAPHSQTTPQKLKAALKPVLSAYKHPKHWHWVAQLPRNAQGKVNRSVVMEWLTASIAPVRGSGDDAGDSCCQYRHGE
ncbi:2-succinylbenzoate--CoA ligase [Leptolyngbyaceae cyanobacterium CCMR0081]|uniref:2-succinylbenzoate--CoA ligase n=2 Tax=Adonisia TaxID=2950183 RepID=A0A6M0RNR3_9CYAN|nr:2-succinylbenzoate--CoA ligase [Adonisia turfae CCMR0081]